MTLPRATCGSNSSISSTVQLCFSRSEISAKRIDLLREQIAVGHRVPDGDDLEAAAIRFSMIARDVWLLPAPVRTAPTATTGFELLICVASGPSRT